MVRGPLEYTDSGTQVVTAKNKGKCGFVFVDGLNLDNLTNT